MSVSEIDMYCFDFGLLNEVGNDSTTHYLITYVMSDNSLRPENLGKTSRGMITLEGYFSNLDNDIGLRTYTCLLRYLRVTTCLYRWLFTPPNLTLIRGGDNIVWRLPSGCSIDP